MKIEVKKMYLVESINFLHGITLKSKKSRHRSKFIKMLEEKLEQLKEEQQMIIKEYAELDEYGEPIIENGNYKIKDKDVKNYKEDQKELLNEIVVFEGGDVTGYLKTIKEIIFEYDEEVSGRTAEVYDYLFEVFENADNTENKEEVNNG